MCGLFVNNRYSRIIAAVIAIILLLRDCSCSISESVPADKQAAHVAGPASPTANENIAPGPVSTPRKRKTAKKVAAPLAESPSGPAVQVVEGKVTISPIMQRLFGTPIDYSSGGTKSLEMPIGLYVNNHYAGNDLVKVKTGAVVVAERFYSELILKRLKPFLIDEEFERLKEIFSSTQTASVEDLDAVGVKSSYDISDGSIHLSVPNEWIRPTILSFGYGDDADLEPNTMSAPFSGYVNTKLSRSFIENPGTATVYNTNLNATGVISAFGVSAHSGLAVMNDKARRTESALIIPWSKGRNQVWIGDTRYHNNMMISDYPEVTGIAYFRDHALRPQDYDIDAGAFEAKNNSRVQIFKNEVLYREFQRGPGKFGIQDVPLEVGENVIRVVIQDLVTGERTERVVNDFLPLQFVPAGDWSHAVGYGVRRSETTDGIDYSDKPTAFAGGMYGLTKSNSVGGSVLAEDKYSKLTLIERLQTRYGAFAAILSRSEPDAGASGHRGTLQYSCQFKDSPIRSASLSHSFDDANYKSSATVVANQRSSTSANFGFKPFAQTVVSTGLSNVKTYGSDINSAFITIGRNFRINRHWSVGLTGGHVWSDRGSNDSRAMVTLTFNDSVLGGRAVARERESLERSETALSFQSPDDYSIDVNSSRIRDTGLRANNLRATKKFERAVVTGSYSGFNSEPGQSGSISIETGLAFTNKTYAWTRPISGGFIIFESAADRGIDYEVGNGSGRRVGVSGNLLRTWVVPVGNYTTSYFTSSFLDPQYFTLESSNATIYRSGFRTGTESFLLSDTNTYVTLTVVDANGAAVLNTHGEVVCSKPDDVIANMIFTNAIGETNFFVKRGAECHLKFGNTLTETLDLSWPTKYRDLGEINLKD